MKIFGSNLTPARAKHPKEYFQSLIASLKRLWARAEMRESLGRNCTAHGLTPKNRIRV